MIRFWSKVKKSSGCWEWIASLDHQGYGHFKFNGKMVGAHRMSYMIRCGDIPKGMCVLHKCDNPICVRPSHLFLGTLKDNTQDMLRKGRFPNYQGENHNRSKLKNTDVIQIRALYYLGNSLKDLSKLFKISKPHISRIIKRQSWSHI